MTLILMPTPHQYQHGQPAISVPYPSHRQGVPFFMVQFTQHFFAHAAEVLDAMSCLHRASAPRAFPSRSSWGLILGATLSASKLWSSKIGIPPSSIDLAQVAKQNITPTKGLSRLMAPHTETMVCTGPTSFLSRSLGQDKMAKSLKEGPTT